MSPNKHRHLIGLSLALLLSGCGGPLIQDANATLEAENQGIVAEATAIRAAAAADQTRVIATAQAVETRAFEINALNRGLLSTVRAVVPPTQAIIAANPVSTGAAPAPPGGERSFIQTGIGTAVRDEDGCIERPAIEFPSSTPRLYSTMKAFNITEDTALSIQWTRNNEVVWQEAMNASFSAAEICVWFDITSDAVPFTPGDWAATWFANGEPIQTPMNFTITEG